MRAFVAGATGYVGSAIVPLLVARDVQTLAHVRPDSSRLEEHRERFKAAGAIVDTTAWTDEAMAARFEAFEPHLVFACLGTTRARKRSSDDPENETYEAIDYGLTAILIRAAAALETKPRFVYLSSAGVTEQTTNAYLAARWKAEQELRESGMPYTIARPAIISGTNREENRPAERLGAVVGDALLGAIGALGFSGVRDRWSSMTNEELAQALVDYALSSDGADRILDPADLRERL